MNRLLRGVLLSLLAACSDATTYEPGTYAFPQDAETVPDDAVTVTFPVSGMTCSGCEYNVTSAIRRTDGALRARADQERGEATVTFDPAVTDLAALVAAVSAIGYEARMPADDGD